MTYRLAPGNPHPTCLGSENRMIGAVHQVGMAAARTKPGGVVYVPNFAGKDYAIWVDAGCGTLSDGINRAKCPPAYTPYSRNLPHFAQSGPRVRGDRVQANRGVKIVAEGYPDRRGGRRRLAALGRLARGGYRKRPPKGPWPDSVGR